MLQYYVCNYMQCNAYVFAKCIMYTILDKFKSKLSKWKARSLSFSGRVTLAKSVLGSLPAYFLSIFAAPKCVLKKLESIRRDFVWGFSDSKKKLRWIKWDGILKSKKRGGLGIGKLADFNLAMLSKWWWRHKADPNQLWARVISSIHSINSGNSLIPLNKNIPGSWKDIGNADASLLSEGIILADSLIEVEGVWKWRTSKDAPFSVKQVREDIEAARWVNMPNEPKLDWNNWATPKGNHLLWRVMLGRVASRVGLARRGIPIADIGCPRCGLEAECPDHIFLKCLWSRSIWWNILAWIRISFPADCDSFSDLIKHIKESPGSKVWKRLVHTIIIATTWRIWSARNAMVFDGSFIPIMKTVELIKEDSFLWINIRARIKKPVWEDWVRFDVLELL
ncbi:uncharacterized protein LOC110866587 [Helianthus annuus]|uniref:uncharacterized protein LOC110866587 n=1 Tax=Helianthus annuus TaxID=4232 RepID=UPI000B90A48A|nr:uncharacterized protein LOC110866587 [Helianthus annuus]